MKLRHIVGIAVVVNIGALAITGWWMLRKPPASYSPPNTAISVDAVERLVKSGGLQGKTKSEVVLLLGEKYDAPQYPGEWDMTYWLSPSTGFFPIDSRFLAIRFADGVVVEAVIRED